MDVFITGGTGYLGQQLIPHLIRRGHGVVALTRAESREKLPPGCAPIVGDALDRSTFERHIAPAETFVQLIGVPHPSPAKAAQFRAIDLVSIRESVAAAVRARIRHFVYVSVAQPAPVMRDYVEVRAEGERLLRESRLNATCLRPWYVLGPGHRWAVGLKPLYWLFKRIPSKRETALRLGLVTLDQMVAALVEAVEHPATGMRIVDVPEIRRSRMI